MKEKCSKYGNLCLLICLFLGFILFPFKSNAQKQTDSIAFEQPYILKLDTVINVRLIFTSDFSSLVIHKLDNDLDIRPNSLLKTKLGFSYRYISFKINIFNELIGWNLNNNLRGETETWNFGFKIINIFLQEINFGYEKGYYVQNTQDYDSNWTQGVDPYIQFPGLKKTYFTGSTGFRLNPKYSVRAIKNQTEIQNRNAGSFIPTVYYNYNKMENTENQEQNIQAFKNKSFEFIFGIGYWYTWVLNKYIFVTSGIESGIGYQYDELYLPKEINKQYQYYNNPVYFLKGNISLGYHFKNFFLGIEGLFERANNPVVLNNDVLVNTTSKYFQFFLGYRFKSPHIIKKSADKAKEVLPKKIQPLIE